MSSKSSVLSPQSSKPTRVCVMGLGYIGLPTAAVMASRGLEVVGVDIVDSVVDTINRGEIQFAEPDLDIVVRSVVQAGRLRCFVEPQPADVFIIAVPTPLGEARQPDLSHVEAAARSLAPLLEAGNTVILESTCPVGTTEQLCAWLGEERPDLSFPHKAGQEADIRVAHCPERVLPGRVLQELVGNDRIIGGMTSRCADAACDLYRRFVRGELVRTNVRTAEMCKLAENAYRDVNIAFANELSLVCEQHGIDPWELIELANRHPRVDILQPGVGVGGHCIAVDPWFLIASAPELARLMTTAREVNEYKPVFVAQQVMQALPDGEVTVACLGLAFKPNVEDLRSSPAVQVVQLLAEHSRLTVLAVEPHVNALPPELADCSNVRLVSLDDALEQADLSVALVAHTALQEDLNGRRLDLARMIDVVNLLGLNGMARS
ncbi:UDP-N-acetyl-D-mannosamine dehydrogenase [Natronospira bacteriovora]|uniref:UDP-N-acetyl-D-mannosamine dehydrogenase n=1 Tax=Natronospira bacteriovora TaxID=3069753 RepID=A0ABU0W7W4_9GAMM|nr:UDP-N-acetyl-D-mannosamine dehydrogenase [Natronospira sp. AB-CW4]MDQ2070128.1 UDP-N-acetyl-D-mannosamine dehydrogenase [Natronospira sp. AB-CW4]